MCELHSSQRLSLPEAGPHSPALAHFSDAAAPPCMTALSHHAAGPPWIQLYSWLGVLRNICARSAPVAADFGSLKRQRCIFTIVNLLLLSVLLFLHTYFASFWGRPAPSLLLLLGTCLSLRAIELTWLNRHVVTPNASTILTLASIGLNLLLAIVLASVMDREDSQYFALLVVPVLESAFRFGLPAALGTATAAGGIAFYWVWRYYLVHPPASIEEYFEAGTMALIFLTVGALTAVMSQHLREKQQELARYVDELERTRQRLLQEETLAAVGRLSSAVAHEIRNPVAMISSSLATARALTGAARAEMFEIATEEAARLVTLTNDFLAYARPRTPVLVAASIRDVVFSIADACRAHAMSRGVSIEVGAGGDPRAMFDATITTQALMNLIMNGIDASPAAGAVKLSITATDVIRVDVENRGAALPPSVTGRLFEPFFTTKPRGTGLGLAIARSLTRIQGGELTLSVNEPGRVCFSLTLPKAVAVAAAAAS